MRYATTTAAFLATFLAAQVQALPGSTLSRMPPHRDMTYTPPSLPRYNSLPPVRLPWPPPPRPANDIYAVAECPVMDHARRLPMAVDEVVYSPNSHLQLELHPRTGLVVHHGQTLEVSAILHETPNRSSRPSSRVHVDVGVGPVVVRSMGAVVAWHEVRSGCDASLQTQLDVSSGRLLGGRAYRVELRVSEEDGTPVACAVADLWLK